MVGCPDCSTPIALGSQRCRSCGLLLVGRAAARLWEVDQQLTGLRAERTTLLADLRSRSDLAPAAVGAPGAPAEHPTSAPVPPYPAARLGTDRPSGRGPGIGVQRLILGTGAALVVVAAIVFAAVAWTVVPVAGQAALMVAATAASAVASAKVAARGLRGSAETLATVTVGLLLVDIAAARSLDLAGLEGVDADWYAAAGAALAAAVSAGLVRLARDVAGPHVYAWAAVVAAALAPALGTAAADAPVVVFALVALVAAAAFARVCDRMTGAWAVARPAALVVAAAYATASTALSVAGSFLQPLLGEPGARHDSALAFATVALSAAGLLRVPTARFASPVVCSLPVLVAGAAGLGLCSHSRYGVLVLSLLGAAAAALAAAGWTRLARHAGPLLRRTLVAGHGVAAAALATFAVETADGSPVDRLDVHLLAVGLAAIAAAAALTAVLVPVAAGARAGLTAYAGAALLLAAGLATSPAHDRLLSTAAVLVAAIAIAATAAWRCGTPDEPLLALVAGGGFLAAAAVASGDPRTLALVAGSAGLTCLAYAMLPARGPVAAAGVAGCSVASWLLLSDAGVHLVEAYSLPLAALAAVVGGVRLVREPRASSWATVGAALVAGLAPSALASVGDAGLTRPLGVLVVGAAVVAAGLRLRWQAPVVVGAAALLVVAVAQLAPYAVGVPRWLSLGGVGVALLVLGIRYERTRQAAAGVARWAHRLH